MTWTKEAREWAATAILVAVLVGLLSWSASTPSKPRQYEVTLGDRTKATCVVVQGVRSAGVSCVPHTFLGDGHDE